MKIILLKEYKFDHWQILFNGDGPYSISSTKDDPPSDVLQRIRKANPGAVVELEANVNVNPES